MCFIMFSALYISFSLNFILFYVCLSHLIKKIDRLTNGYMLTQKSDNFAVQLKTAFRAGGSSPHNLRLGDLTYAQGPHVTYETFFPAFIMFSKYL